MIGLFQKPYSPFLIYACDTVLGIELEAPKGMGMMGPMGGMWETTINTIYLISQYRTLIMKF
jgi:hypothetical protein